MDRDVLPIIEGPQGVSLEDYRDEVMRRFSNPAVGDQLLRIASDGANKIPTFLSATLRTALDQKRDLSRLAFVLACFARYFAGVDDQGQRFVPIEPNLPDSIGQSIARDPLALLTAPPLAGLDLDRSGAFRQAFERALMLIDDHGVLGALERLPIAS
jgi:mannitol-1-phosphate/altronate dehydrogenase